MVPSAGHGAGAVWHRIRGTDDHAEFAATGRSAHRWPDADCRGAYRGCCGWGPRIASDWLERGTRRSAHRALYWYAWFAGIAAAGLVDWPSTAGSEDAASSCFFLRWQ